MLGRFDYRTDANRGVPSLAFHSAPLGDLYLSEEGVGIRYLKLPVGPEIVPEACKVKPGGLGSVVATLQAEVNPEGKETHFHFEVFNGSETIDGASTLLSTKLGTTAVDFELHEASQKVSGLKPETNYQCRVFAENADSVTPAAGVTGSFETKESFEFGPAFPSPVGETQATLNAEGNPLGLAATAQIEYVEDAKFKVDRFAQATLDPTVLNFGNTEALTLKSAVLSGLKPQTTYHWRLHVNNGLPPQGFVCPRNGPEPCPVNEHVFRTYGPGEAADNRGWELVSPGQKNSAEVVVPKIPGGIFEDNNIRIQAAAGSGEAATYTSFTSFGQAEGAPATSQYLSKRTPGGWVTQNLSPFGFQSPIQAIPFKGFTPELGTTVFKVSKGSLAPGCPDDVENLYERDNADGSLTCLTPQPPSTNSNCFVYSGASEDGARVFFAALARYAEAKTAPPGQGYSLYEWSAAEGLHAISILPGESGVVAPAQGTKFGPAANPCQWGQTIMRHAVSADGTKAFWTYKPEVGTEKLLAHVLGAETVQLDKAPKTQAKEKPGPAEGGGLYWAASKDGSVVYFTATGKLISGSKAEAGSADLYRYEFGKAEPLSDLTKGAVADVQGVVGASDDGAWVYFVAHGVLNPEANPAGEKAKEGAENLYLAHGKETTFIAQLSPEDLNDWESQPRSLSARVTPDGQHLAFLSTRSQALAGYENTVAAGVHCQWNPLLSELFGGPLCPQAFVYDAGAKTLSCASCNPSGARPLGPTLLPAWSNVFEGPRYLADNGSRLFFESYDALLEGDENGKRDIYEFERPGSGSCSSTSNSFDPAAGGCHYLVSDGKSGDESYLVDASSSGRDVFFSTRAALTGWDTNPNYDVYDYREGGGFPEPAPEVSCAGEGCEEPAPPSPAQPTPATPSFNGPGNVKAKKPKPQHHKKKHKHKHKKQKAKKKQPTKSKGRAGR